MLAPTEYLGVPVPEDLRPNWGELELEWWRRGIQAAKQPPRQFGNVIMAQHYAYVEISEAAGDIEVSVQLLASLDPAIAHVDGDTLVITNGPSFLDGEVVYRFDGWNAKGASLTAHKIRDTRPTKRENK